MLDASQGHGINARICLRAARISPANPSLAESRIVGDHVRHFNGA